MRIAVALLAVMTLTAFAPAPFPRARRSNDTTTLLSCQGTWRVEHLQVAGNQGELTRSDWGVSHIRITDDRWALMNNDSVVADVYRIAIDPAKAPAHIDWLSRDPNDRTVSYVGIARRQGNRLLITFINGSTNRPASFESLPAGTYLVTASR